MELEKYVNQRAELIVAEAEKATELPTESEGKTFSEMAKDYANVRATLGAVQDGGLQEALVDKRKEELLADADTQLKKAAVENKEIDIKLQEADYGVYAGVATYAGIKKPLPKKMQNILFLILSVFQTLFLIVFGIPVSIINMVADGVDSVVKKLGSLTKSAMWIVLAAIIVGSALILFYVVRVLLAKVGIII